MDHKDTTQERKIVRCPKCTRPVAEVRGNKVYILRGNAGKPMTVGISIKHDAGGRFDLDCESCGAFAFSTVQKALSMTYVIAKKDGAVDKPV
ncbi:MAG: hypothetical protein PHD72_02065 [Patescibacteria group bacterium]|nr:hypothetical protein [Patescibacteria group bacterium]